MWVCLGIRVLTYVSLVSHMSINHHHVVLAHWRIFMFYKLVSVQHKTECQLKTVTAFMVNTSITVAWLSKIFR